jgi:hypothetical protein
VTEGIPAYEKIAGVFNFEMIGYYCDVPDCQDIPSGFCSLFPDVCDSMEAQQNKGNFITNVANVYSNPLRYRFDSCARLYVPQLRVLSLATPGNGEITPDLRRSDHAPFWVAGYMALMITDGANFRNPHYHTAGDTIGTLNIQFMTNVVKATLAALASSAGIENSAYAITRLFTLVGISKSGGVIPDKFALYQNYPNPFNPVTKIKFSLPLPSPAVGGINSGGVQEVRLVVYDVLGSVVATLVNGPLSPGEYEVEWDATSFPSGVYFYKLITNEFSDTKKMLLIK